LSRTLEFLRTGNLDEVEFVLGKGAQILPARKKAEQSAVASQTKALETPRRKRRTKAEIAQAAREAAEKAGQTTIASGAQAAGHPPTIPISA
jgi:hypothetical protein